MNISLVPKMLGKSSLLPILAILAFIDAPIRSVFAQNSGVPAFTRPVPEKDVAPEPLPSVPPQASPAPTGASADSRMINSAANDYMLTASDTLEMSIFHEPDLSTRSHIGSDGTVQLPLLGDVKVAGMTVRDARELIRKGYDARFLVNPQVYLNVVDYAQRKFTILGQVLKPGTYEIPGGSTMTLLEAVGVAGGFTRSADRGKVVVQRSTDSKKKETIKVNAKKLTGTGRDGFEVQPGDVITISESWF